LKEGLPEKSKLVQHAYEEGHRVIWDEARILEFESNSRHKKYKELANMMFEKPEQPTQSRYLSHLDPPYH
jgi:hypothetical protein